MMFLTRCVSDITHKFWQEVGLGGQPMLVAQGMILNRSSIYWPIKGGNCLTEVQRFQVVDENGSGPAVRLHRGHKTKRSK